MSTSFEIFPTKNNIPKCDVLIKRSLELTKKFLKEAGIEYNISIKVKEIPNNGVTYTTPCYLTSKKQNYTIFNLNNEGEVYVYFQELTELDRQFWEDEFQQNDRAKNLKKKIQNNEKIGYSWSVKRTMGQPAIVGIYYGYLTIAIALLTNGVIYSDDGAWDFSCFPIEVGEFVEKYMNINTIDDIKVKENVEKWIRELFLGDE